MMAAILYTMHYYERFLDFTHRLELYDPWDCHSKSDYFPNSVNPDQSTCCRLFSVYREVRN